MISCLPQCHLVKTSSFASCCRVLAPDTSPTCSMCAQLFLISRLCRRRQPHPNQVQMEAAGIGNSSGSPRTDSPCQSDELACYASAREESSSKAILEAVVWDPYMPHDLPSVVMPVCLSDATCCTASTVPTPLHILNTLDAKDHVSVKLPFKLDMITVATRDASTLSHCLHVCQVSSDTVFELGIGLWGTQHVTEDPTNLQTMDAVLHEGLLGKSICFLISFFRRVLDDTCTDKLHEAILELLKQLIPGSTLARHWKTAACS